MAPPRKVRFDAAVVQKAEENSKKRTEVSSDDDSVQQDQVLRAKKARREGDETDDDDPTEISKKTSLEAEGIEIEPFHMKNENTDGTGYFDGDTYVFRKQLDEEPDAWLDQLNDDNDASNHQKGPIQSPYDPTKVKSKKSTTADPMDEWSEDALYAKIRPCLATDTETIMDAIARYGTLLNTGTPKARQLAKEAFDSLTEAASAFMLRGNINIYQMKRSQLITPHAAAVSSSDISTPEAPVMNGSKIQWEYKGSADGQIHGPYDTQDMINWIQAGYFVGPSAVQVRSIETSSLPSKPDAAETSKSTQDDLLSDLMDDDDEEDSNKKNEQQETTGSSYTIRGEWQMSDQINFTEYRVA